MEKTIQKIVSDAPLEMPISCKSAMERMEQALAKEDREAIRSALASGKKLSPKEEKES